jgi:hypothetical protein
MRGAVKRNPGDRRPPCAKNDDATKCGEPRFWMLRLIRAPLSTHTTYSVNMAQSDEEDDYMNMVFEDAPKGPKYETSLQRAARKRKEVRLFSTTMTRIADNSTGRS